MITEALTCVGPAKLRREDGLPVEWRVAAGLVEYEFAGSFAVLRDRHLDTVLADTNQEAAARQRLELDLTDDSVALEPQG